MCRTMAHGEEIVEYTTEGGERDIAILKRGKEYSSLSLPTGARWNLGDQRVQWEEKKRRWREARRRLWWWVTLRANYDAKKRFLEQDLTNAIDLKYLRPAKVVSATLDLDEDEQRI